MPMTPSEKYQPEQSPAENPDDKQSSTRFRFKRKHHDSDKHQEDRSNRRRQKWHHDGHHQRKKHKNSPRSVDDPSGYDDSFSNLPPESAFRESLFDAMADDEGAAFWEGVYGQPMHSYSSTYQDRRTGKLEQMDDEEYAQFVRKKMWEKSWEGIEAAKKERIQEREQEKQKMQEEWRSVHDHEVPKPQANYLFDLDIERSLQRGERRRDRKRWKGVWEQYLRRWEELRAAHEAWSGKDNEQPLYLRNKIAWPVESGKRKDVGSEEVERFFKRCADTLDDGGTTLSGILKSERVRWHPDKIQQRYGFMGIDDNTTQGVTAVFQIIDQMWSSHRDNG